MDPGGCTVTKSETHYNTDQTGKTVYAQKTCNMTPQVAYKVNSDHWTGDPGDSSTSSTHPNSLACPPLSQCQGEPPEGCPEGQAWHTWFCECQPESPIILDLAGDGYELGPAMSGVHFDLNIDGRAELISWTAPTSNDGFLVLDRNGNQTVDDGSELFGNYTPASGVMSPTGSNGFEALAALEVQSAHQSGTTADGVIDGSDAAFHQLQVWVDANHNGISEAIELQSLKSHGITALGLNYRRSGRIDQYGNEFKFRAVTFVLDKHGKEKSRPYFDVFLQTP
jgi:hypothetical protein